MEIEKVKEIKIVLKGLVDDASNWLQKAMIGGVNLADILTLINELESENERLLEQRNKTYNIWVKDTEKLKDRIAELEKENEILKGTKDRLTFADRIELVNNAVETKLKQLAEKLKESAGQHYVSQNGVRISDITYSISDGTINKILKECLCDNNQ